MFAWTDHLPEILNQRISLAHAQLKFNEPYFSNARNRQQSTCLTDDGDKPLVDVPIQWLERRYENHEYSTSSVATTKSDTTNGPIHWLER